MQDVQGNQIRRVPENRGWNVGGSGPVITRLPTIVYSQNTLLLFNDCIQYFLTNGMELLKFFVDAALTQVEVICFEFCHFDDSHSNDPQA